tara:strand:- start:64 stop:366 length:303 start_codon:yes stop_codon:yes gene_type:complete
VEIKNKKSFNKLLETLVLEIIEEEDELEEITVTGDVAGYNTPNAFEFDPEGKEKKKKYKKSLKKVNEALDSKDIEIIKKLIRDVIGDVYRDIWIKRNSWK